MGPCGLLAAAEWSQTLMKSPALQSMLTLYSSRLTTSLGSAMTNAAQASWGLEATKVKWPSVANMSRHPGRQQKHDDGNSDEDNTVIAALMMQICGLGILSIPQGRYMIMGSNKLHVTSLYDLITKQKELYSVTLLEKICN